MKSNFIFRLLLCLIVPFASTAQSKQKPYVIHRSQQKHFDTF
jgi:hypothetical protein